MIEDIDSTRGKSVGDLGQEAFWYVAHTVIAVVTLLIAILIVSMGVPSLRSSFGPDSVSDYNTVKLIFTGIAFFLPAIVGFFIAQKKHNDIARYVWISGLLMFSVVCVWVNDLPTGPGMCEHCGALEKLYRTFSIYNGSGLMGEQGVLVGVWVPLSMIGYAVGSAFGLRAS